MKRTEKYLKSSFLLIFAGALASGLSGCNDDPCKDLSRQLIQPLSAAEALLATFQTGKDVVTSCRTLLSTLSTIPEGAQSIRSLAATKFTDSSSTCTDLEIATRWEYQCSAEEKDPVCRGIAVTYQYCAAYEHHSTQDSYRQAMDISAHLDILYERANSMCGLAVNGNLEAALGASQEVESYLTHTVKPETDQGYAAVCSASLN
jgi:hypothetical protein